MRGSDTKWWGWGAEDKRSELSPSAERMIAERLGEAEPSPVLDRDRVRLPAPAKIPGSIERAVGAENVLADPDSRLRHSTGMSYPDLIRLRSGEIERAPDAIVTPSSHEQVAAVLEACARKRVAVVPFGGGTSVVGGVDPDRGPFERVIALDLARIRHVEVDDVSLTARMGPGLTGPDAERELSAAGMTLGHFPQSFEYATIGGFAATRSAGQASTGFGRFDSLVTSLRLAAPAGELVTLKTPHTAAGPSLRELVLGSEGAFGVITDVTARVRRVPETTRYEAWMAADFASGAEMVRGLAQSGALPDVVRVSDREETGVSMAIAGSDGAAHSAANAYLRLRRRADGCIVIVGWEGEREAVARRRALAERALRSGGAVSLGSRPGRSWHRGRYEGPYFRDELLERGYLVDTLETAHTWSRLGELHDAVATAILGALEAQGTPGITFAHLSHAYRDGASLYFTLLARRRPGDEIAQWHAAKEAASHAIASTGGTITHHHGIGRDHMPYMRAEVGEIGMETLQAVKARLDPAGIMNPGKLVDLPA